MFQQPLFQYAMWRMPRTVNFAPGEVGLRSVSPAGHQYGIQRLPTDPVGTTTVTFSGVVVGSEIRVYLPDGPNGAAGTEVAGLDSCVENQQLSWAVYAPGSPNNNVWVHILKRGLRWQKFPYTSKAGAQSIPIFQNTDLGYNNPA